MQDKTLQRTQRTQTGTAPAGPPDCTILDQMAEVEKAAKKATPRPWRAWADEGSHHSVCSYSGDKAVYCHEDCVASTFGDKRKGNADYIAAAANHTPDIIAFTRRLLEVARLANDRQHFEAMEAAQAIDRDYPGALARKGENDAQDQTM